MGLDPLSVTPEIMNKTPERETRVSKTRPLSYKVEWDDFKKKRTMLQLNRSKNGMGGLAFGSQFPGRGSMVQSDEGNFVIRWVKVRFGYLYSFGLQAV